MSLFKNLPFFLAVLWIFSMLKYSLCLRYRIFTQSSDCSLGANSCGFDQGSQLYTDCSGYQYIENGSTTLNFSQDFSYLEIRHIYFNYDIITFSTSTPNFTVCFYQQANKCKSYTNLSGNLVCTDSQSRNVLKSTDFIDVGPSSPVVQLQIEFTSNIQNVKISNIVIDADINTSTLNGIFGCNSWDNTNCQACYIGFNQITLNGKQICQLQCQSGKYPYISDSTYFIQYCRSCSSNCLSCTNNLNCLTCDSNYDKINTKLGENYCFLKCDPKQFRNSNNICQNCIQNCNQCVDSQTCQTCDSLYDNVTISVGVNECKLKCNSNQFRNSNSDCQNCMAGCLQCIDGQSCQNCDSSYDQIIVSPGMIQCFQKCASNQFRNSNLQCQNCVLNCTSCVDGDSCSSCQSQYQFSSSAKYCVPICASNQYHDSNFLCQNCVQKCDSCSNGQSCTSCQSGYQFLSAANYCVLICGVKKYYDQNFQCQNCVQNCDSCHDGQSCSSCQSGYIFSQQANYCVQICNSNQYRDQNYICSNCDQSCSTCQGPGINNCLSCKQNWFFLNYRCYQVCPNNYIVAQASQCVECQKYTSQCQQCAATCRSCQYGDKNICLDCYQTMNFQQQSQTCICKNNIDNRNIFYECSHENVAVVQATLSSDSPKLTLEFGVPLVLIQNINCNQIFEKNTLDLLGQSTCIINSSQIVISLSQDSFIMSNNTLSFKNNILQYEYNQNNNIKIDTFYLASFTQLMNQSPQINYQHSQTQSTCNDAIFKILANNILNDAKRGFYSFSWSISTQPNVDQSTQAKLNQIIQNANQLNSTTLLINKYLIPDGTQVSAYFSYTLKINYQGVLNLQTQIMKEKEIIISSIQNRYPPIYRYMDLSFYFAFQVQTCDQAGPTAFIEPLDIKITSQIMPDLNKIINSSASQQIQIDVNKYLIPFNTQFDLLVEVSLHSNQAINQKSQIQFTPQLSDLLVYIQGGESRQFNYKKEISLTGIGRDYEVEDSNSPQGINLNWECKSLVKNNGDFQCYDYLKNVVNIPQNVASISIAGSTFLPYQTVQFTFTGKKDTRESTKTLVAILSEVDIPPLTIMIEKQTQLVQVNMNEDINVSIEYDTNISSDTLTYAGAVLYNNEVVGTIKFDFYKVRFRIWDFFNNVLPINPVVQVRFTVYNPAYIMPSLSITNFNINLPPTNCQFTVTPSSGEAFVTVFQIQMIGCYSKNTPLTYQFFYYTNSNDFKEEKTHPTNILRRIIIDQTTDQQFNTVLPSGNLLIMGQVMDSFLATFNSTVQVTINNIQQGEQQLLNTIDTALQINTQQITKQKLLNLCILGEEISKNIPIYNLNSVNQRKPQLIESIISLQNNIPTRSFLPTFSNKVISQIKFSIPNSQQSSSQNILDQIFNILQKNQQISETSNQLQNNNNIDLQNLVDSFKMLNSTTQSFSDNLINQQMNISDKICNDMSKLSLPNTGGLQLKGNLISLNCQQITQKNLEQYVMQFNDDQQTQTQVTNLYSIEYSTYSQNPYIQTPAFQNYTQELIKYDPQIQLTQNKVIKPTIINLQASRYLSDTANTNQSYIFKFPNALLSKTNQTCLQKLENTWSSSNCQTVNFNQMNSYYCYCKKLSSTTVTDDLESLIQNKNLQTAFGSQGIENLSNFSNFYKFAVVWILFSTTILQIGLYFFGQRLDQKQILSGDVQILSGEVQIKQLDKVYPIQNEKEKQDNISIKINEETSKQGEDQQILQDDNEMKIQQQINDKNRRKESELMYIQEINIDEQFEANKIASIQKQEDNLLTTQKSENKMFSNQSDKLIQIDQQNNGSDDYNLQQQNLEQTQKQSFQFTNRLQFDNIIYKTPQQSALSKLISQQSNNKDNQEQVKQSSAKSSEDTKNSLDDLQNVILIDKFNKLISKGLLFQLLIFHDFFSIFYIFDDKVSRSIRFTLFYLRIIHSLAISTIFDESYTIEMKIVISLISSVILIVGDQIVTLFHKIKKVGHQLSAIIIISLLLFYYYIILSITSGQEPSTSNFRIVYFLLMVGVDFFVMLNLNSLLKIKLVIEKIKYKNKDNLFSKLYSLLSLDIILLNLNI